MGLDYSFDITIPRDSTYDFVRCLVPLCRETDVSTWVWPDGRELKVPGWRGYGYDAFPDSPDKVPVDGAFDGGGCLSILFQPDEPLSDYLTDLKQDWEQKKGTPWPNAPDQFGRYRVGCIYIAINLGVHSLDWFGDSPLVVTASFTAATTRMSRLFEESTVIRQAFVDLTQIAGGILCGLDKEESGWEPLYLRGAALSGEDGWGDLDPRTWLLTYGLTNYDAESLKAKRRLERLPYGRVNAEEQAVVVEGVQHHDGGTRASAIRRLKDVDEEPAISLFRVCLEDEDWRIRAVATATLGEYRSMVSHQGKIVSPTVIEILLRALRDPHPEVRIAAAQGMRFLESEQVFDALLERIQNLAARQPELGVLLQCIRSIPRPSDDSRRMQAVIRILQARLEEPLFPLKNEVQKKLEWLRAAPAVVRP